MEVTERMKYMQEYRKGYNARRKQTTTEMFSVDRFDHSSLKVEPTNINFKGNDAEEPIVCSHFGCANHLTPEQQLYGTKCIHHQKHKKQDAGNFVSH